jgi:hypothetical protein
MSSRSQLQRRSSGPSHTARIEPRCACKRRRIVFHLAGYNAAIEGSSNKRAIVSLTTFATDDDRYRWLNDVVAVREGTIDFQTLRVRMRYYAPINEAT